MSRSTDTDTLLDLVEQWRIERMQVINWGGFDGYRSVDFASRATLISGASGTGKSSLMDAYLAVMMPSDVPFNGASNDAAVGRARNPDQRNLLTYLRGKVDSARDPQTGAMRDINLRGTDQLTWGAVAVTFLNDDDRRFTVVRAYLVPRRALRTGDLSMTMATVDGPFELTDLEAFVPKRFDAGELQGRIPGFVVRDTYAELSYTLHTRLGIGAGGDGGRAMRLLARIQAGQHLPTVDGLYKSMVLERPSTYDAADRALSHFEALDEAYLAMETESRKARVLERLGELRREYEDGHRAAADLERLGFTEDGTTPFTVWRSRAHEALLDEAVSRNRREKLEAGATLEAARARAAAAGVRVRELERQVSEQGGSALRRAEERREAAEATHAEVARARSLFDERTEVLDDPIEDEASFRRALGRSEDFLADDDTALDAIETDRAQLHREAFPLEERNTELRRELQSLRGRDGAVPDRLHRARLALAEAAGLDPEQLPFVAELIDVAPAYAAWRPAIEVTLHGLARTVLVDEEHLDAFGRAIDAVRIPVRLQFEGVPLHEPSSPEAGDPAFISGRVTYRTSPFSTWIEQRVTSDRIDARCVESPSELSGGGRRVTVNGQLRDGRRGSHGDTGGAPILGFTNEARIASIEAETAEIRGRLELIAGRQAGIQQRLSRREAERAAHRYRLDTEWARIDVAGAAAHRDAAAAELERLLDASDVLQELQGSVAAAQRELDAANAERFPAEDRVRRLDEEHGVLVDQQDAATTTIDRFERSEVEEVSPADVDRIEAALAAVGGVPSLSGFGDAMKRLRARLGDELSSAVRQAEQAALAQVHVFEQYQSIWHDPNLGTTLESYGDYRAILDGILGTGLPERRQEWRRRLSQWSGEDLVPLSSAFDSAVEEIEDRLVPVNDILRDLPFGPAHDRLKIVLRRVHREEASAFRRELRALSSEVTANLGDDELEARFQRLRRFMESMRDTGAGSQSTRDQVLDVRRHVEITAVRYDTSGQDVSVYSSLGDKSGGETQELVAFIVGAALRYQLGDEDRPRPRFAPVLLDEGFIKADSEFAGRAVVAWLRLGFQLVIGAPLDKVTALEPYMDRLLSIRKDPETRHAWVAEIERSAPVEPLERVG
ncbi:hypothetical protein ITJ66_10945 [Plantibacter sp. VKM Ac-2885]|uniref:ATP-binding protein n=1 Tax=Plantibacter sp. VKM Ac-2885 TaxID=2783828 RepID=UPI00188A4C38|nr:SbcC/MukB-like Walker B domain-containing protein [Plantibacter sp. VKM Ac-2885]MBF4513001.1 hypothetical protein [Plantibacter sp. VKM Ac-2885]